MPQVASCACIGKGTLLWTAGRRQVGKRPTRIMVRVLLVRGLWLRGMRGVYNYTSTGLAPSITDIGRGKYDRERSDRPH